METELAQSISKTDRVWEDALTLTVPDGVEGICRIGIGELSAENADHRLVLDRGGIRQTIDQTIIDSGWSEEDSFDCGEEFEVKPGYRLVLQYRLGNQDRATIRRASIFVEEVL